MNNIQFNILYTYDYWIVLTILISLFALLYFSLSTSYFLIIKLLLKRNWVEKVITKALFPHQIRFEILHSLMSIVIFALYGLLIIYCYRHQIVTLSFDYNYKIWIDLLILVIWNELHFYLAHKLMHTKWLMGVHRTHHKSVVVTPFSTYSFHPLESIIFGTVMILPMLFIEFELTALIIFPIYHLFFNTLGHSNVKLKSKTGGINKIEISSHHNNHHTKYNSNFGFVFSALDRLFNTYISKKS